MKTILGFDPSLTGFGIVECTPNSTITLGKVIRSTADSSLPRTEDTTRRLRKLSRKLNEIFLASDPELVVSEFPAGYRSAKSAKAAGLVISTIIITAQRHNDTPIEWIAPASMKRIAAGRKDASKRDVIDAACEEFDGLEELLCNRDYKYEIENIGEAAGVLLAGKRSSELCKMFFGG